MPLKLLQAEPGDLPRIVQLENDAFADSPVTPILFPGGKSQDSQDTYVENLLQQWQANSASRTVKVIDTDLNGKIVAFARWYIFIGDDVKFIKTDPNEHQNIPGSNEAAGNDFFGGLLKIRARILGRNPYCCKLFQKKWSNFTPDKPIHSSQYAVHRSSASAAWSRDDANSMGL